ncbi:MAG: short-chain fatty acid transporter [Phycisphaeraceae bacterium]|nr:short-chain fatty acid transporter [Phycisphaeraceae bacterium]
MSGGWIRAIGAWISGVFRRCAPDPFVLALLLTLLTGAIAIGVGYPGRELGVGERATATMRAWGGLDGPGMWSLLAFSMQMCLVMVTGHALAESGPVARLLRRMSGVARDGRSGAAMVACVACLAGIVNWGLGLIVGAILAREVGRALASRGVGFSYPVLAAAGYTTMMVWHGGMSGSAPLSVVTVEKAGATLPREVLAAHAPASGAWIGLDQTLGSTLNLIVTGGLLVIVPLTVWLLAPRTGSGELPRGVRVCAGENESEREEDEGCGAGAIPRWLERSRVPGWVLGLLAMGMVGMYVSERGWRTVGLNEINLAMFAVGLLCHGSMGAYARAAEDAARGCVGVIIQFPLYAGIMSMMQESGLVRMIAEGMVSVADERSLPVLGFLSAALVNLFVPSGGGQWAVQGPIAIESASAMGTPLGEAVMAIAYGDQLTNMLQPFWALPLLAITRVRAREIVGYTACVMAVGGVWIAAMLYIL